MNIPDDKINMLLAKYFADEANAEEEQEVYAWMEAGEENLRYFEGLMRVWEKSREMSQLEIDENQAWKTFRSNYIDKPVSRMRQPLKLWLRVVAAALIILAGSWLGYLLFQKEQTTSVSLLTENNVRVDTLPDRSVVTLNKSTELSYKKIPGSGKRMVSLKGEAFFDVTPDTENPFVITTEKAVIKVVGTSFNIKTDAGHTAVIVSTGIVQVTRGDQQIELYAGERIIVDDSISPLQKTQDQDLLYNYYVSKTFICDNTPLWKLAEKLNEAYGVNIIISNKEAASLPLNVIFSNENLEVILKILKETLMITITQEADTIYIK
ncbi:MAG: FecR domain-containing protein [Chitinophagaceae bacterium]|nr:FecR domain-containing protein [Chitinophagaceae bacterium]MCW5929089.1 FecR domain-containing protein [Chitinophagaceae bacterium]